MQIGYAKGYQIINAYDEYEWETGILFPNREGDYHWQRTYEGDNLYGLRLEVYAYDGESGIGGYNFNSGNGAWRNRNNNSYYNATEIEPDTVCIKDNAGNITKIKDTIKIKLDNIKPIIEKV